MVSTDQIKALRDKTGVSVMECKKALEEAGGDDEKALVLLRKKSSRAAEKKADRTLGAGAVAAYIHASGDVGAMVLLSSETDFVSKNEDFKKLAYEIALHAAAMAPQFVSKEQVKPEDIRAAKEVFEREAEEKPENIRAQIVEGKLNDYLKEKVLLEQSFVKDSSKTIRDLVEEATQKFGERIEVTECVRLGVR